MFTGYVSKKGDPKTVALIYSFWFATPFGSSLKPSQNGVLQIAVLTDTPEDARGGVLCDGRGELRLVQHLVPTCGGTVYLG